MNWNAQDFIGNLLRWFPGHQSELDLLQSLAAKGNDIRSRKCLEGHLTVSACVLPREMDKVLMIFSPKFNRWLLPGGHIDPGEDPVQAAKRELFEECGVKLEPVFFAGEPLHPHGIDIHSIPESVSKKEPEHLHFDLQYLFYALDPNALKFDVDKTEVSDISWRPLQDLMSSYAVIASAIKKMEA